MSCRSQQGGGAVTIYKRGQVLPLSRKQWRGTLSLGMRNREVHAAGARDLRMSQAVVATMKHRRGGEERHDLHMAKRQLRNPYEKGKGSYYKMFKAT